MNLDDEIDSTKEYLAQIEQLERDLARFSIRLNRAEVTIKERDEELRSLRSQNSVASKVKPLKDGTYPYNAFVALIHERLGATNRWQTDFCEQVGIDRSPFAKWRKDGSVPAEMFAAALKLVPSTKRDQRGWSQNEKDELMVRIAKGETHKHIAAALNERWGRFFTTNAITGMADRLSKKKEVSNA